MNEAAARRGRWNKLTLCNVQVIAGIAVKGCERGVHVDVVLFSFKRGSLQLSILLIMGRRHSIAVFCSRTYAVQHAP